jgi:hypothetical protein
VVAALGVLVPLFDLKFLTEFAAKVVKTHGESERLLPGSPFDGLIPKVFGSAVACPL